MSVEIPETKELIDQALEGAVIKEVKELYYRPYNYDARNDYQDCWCPRDIHEGTIRIATEVLNSIGVSGKDDFLIREQLLFLRITSIYSEYCLKNTKKSPLKRSIKIKPIR